MQERRDSGVGAETKGSSGLMKVFRPDDLVTLDEDMRELSPGRFRSFGRYIGRVRRCDVPPPWWWFWDREHRVEVEIMGHEWGSNARAGQVVLRRPRELRRVDRDKVPAVVLRPHDFKPQSIVAAEGDTDEM